MTHLEEEEIRERSYVTARVERRGKLTCVLNSFSCIGRTKRSAVKKRKCKLCFINTERGRFGREWRRRQRRRWRESSGWEAQHHVVRCTIMFACEGINVDQTES
ncbi:hypothetical protein J6590_009137 [Homalodisca vitripennis]|nr:hypothetical protein J6590_009137 [Homalodisca vitripennis]